MKFMILESNREVVILIVYHEKYYYVLQSDFQ